MSTEEDSAQSNTCLACRKALKSSMSDMPDGGPPSDGIIFTSRGNYGSTLYDPTVYQDSTEFLRVVICDECVAAAAADGLVQQGLPQPTPATQYTTWTLPTDPADGMTETEYLLSSPANTQFLIDSIAQSREADVESHSAGSPSASNTADDRPTQDSDPDSAAAPRAAATSPIPDNLG